MQKTPVLPRYLRVAITLSSALSSATIVGCGATNAQPSSTPITPAAGAADAGAAEGGTSIVTSGNDEGPVSKVDDYTAGTGPCRCSWDTNVSGAPRVCKKNETAYNGTYCLPRKRPKYGKYPVIGPLAPPDLPGRLASRGRRTKRAKRVDPR